MSMLRALLWMIAGNSAAAVAELRETPADRCCDVSEEMDSRLIEVTTCMDDRPRYICRGQSTPSGHCKNCGAPLIADEPQCGWCRTHLRGGAW
jgi:hypothetical protein